MSRPPEYRFSTETKREALKRADFKCENCGRNKKETPEQYLEVHHLLAVSMAVRYYPELAPTLVSSLVNALVTCHDCHIILDQEAMGNHKYHAAKLKNEKNP